MKKTLLICLSLLMVIGISAETLTLVAEDYAPYVYQKDGVATGYQVSIAQAAAKKANVDLKIEFYPWARCLNMVKTGKADGLLGCSKTAEREGFMYYPEVSMTNEKVVAFGNSFLEKKIKTINDLKSLTVGVVRGYSYGELFDNDKSIKRDESNNLKTMMIKLKNGRFNVALSDELSAIAMMRELGISNIHETDLVFSIDPQYIGFSKTSVNGKIGLEKMGNALKVMKKNGEIENIINNYK